MNLQQAYAAARERLLSGGYVEIVDGFYQNMSSKAARIAMLVVEEDEETGESIKLSVFGSFGEPLIAVSHADSRQRLWRIGKLDETSSEFKVYRRNRDV